MKTHNHLSQPPSSFSTITTLITLFLIATVKTTSNLDHNHQEQHFTIADESVCKDTAKCQTMVAQDAIAMSIQEGQRLQQFIHAIPMLKTLQKPGTNTTSSLIEYKDVISPKILTDCVLVLEHIIEQVKFILGMLPGKDGLRNSTPGFYLLMELKSLTDLAFAAMNGDVCHVASRSVDIYMVSVIDKRMQELRMIIGHVVDILMSQAHPPPPPPL